FQPSSRCRRTPPAACPANRRPNGCAASAPAPTSGTFLMSARERLDAGLRAPEYEGVNVVRALVGVDHLEVHEVADHAVLVGDAVAAVHVARHARDLERLAARVALHDRGDLRRRLAFVLEPPEAQAALQA